MARDKLTEYSATASENTVCGDVNIAENSALPSDLNNYAREIMTHLKNFSDGTDAIDALTVTGDLLVSTTDTNPTNDSEDTFAFVVNTANHQVRVRSHDLSSLRMNRTGTDGDITQFYKDGSAVGSIGTYLGDMYIGTDDTTDCFLKFGASGGDVIVPAGANGADNDAAISLGRSIGRFKDLYLSGGAYLGGTAAANHLDDYERGTYTISEVNNDCSITSHRGTYVKNGDIVLVSGSFTVSTTSSTSTLNLSLPFTSTIGTNGVGGGNIGFSNLSTTIIERNLRPNIENLAGNMFLRYGSNDLLTCSAASGKRIDFMVIYEADA